MNHTYLNPCVYKPTSSEMNSLRGIYTHTLTNGSSQQWTGASLISITPKVLIWSAADERSLSRLASAYSQYFACLALQPGEVSTYMENLAFTLSHRRSSLPWRSFAVVNSVEQLRGLTLKLSKPIRAISSAKLGFVFTGQGAQWHAMGRELMSFPIFGNSIRSAEACFESFGAGWSLIGMLSPIYDSPLITSRRTW